MRAELESLATALRQRLPDQASLATKAFRFFSAAGRTELGGNHTDHNHGRVLAASITMQTLAATRLRSDQTVRITAEGYELFETDLTDLAINTAEFGSSCALVRGVAAYFKTQGYAIGGFDASVSSTVLRGSGLSSSASFEILIGTIFNHLFNNARLDPVSLAIAGQFAENKYFGKPSGLMDQIACAYGGVVEIDFANPSLPVVSNVQLQPEAFGYALMIVSTGDDHADLTDEYAAIPAEMKAVAQFFGKPVLRGISREELDANINALRAHAGDRAVLRAMHFIDENERPPLMSAAIRQGDFKAFLNLVRESGASSARLLQNLHAPASVRSQCMDLALEVANRCLGSEGAVRVHGGGFGGTIQAWVPLGLVPRFSKLMRSIFGQESVYQLGIRSEPCQEVFPEGINW